jgi:hypothetical protein
VWRTSGFEQAIPLPGAWERLCVTAPSDAEPMAVPAKIVARRLKIRSPFDRRVATRSPGRKATDPQ